MAGRTTQRDHLHGSQGCDVLVEHDPVDAARDAFEKGHHPHRVAVRAEEARGGGRLVGSPNPSHELGAAVEAFAGVSRPDRPIPAIDV